MTREEVLSTLKELGDLKAAGILTDEEFDAKKKELLSALIEKQKKRAVHEMRQLFYETTYCHNRANGQ